MSNLAEKKCVPCEGGAAPLADDEVLRLLLDIPLWKTDGKKIWREFAFKNFTRAMKCINEAADIAEREHHHPDILLYNWNNVRLELSTHAINGLSINDFILAAKIDEMICASPAIVNNS